MPKISFPDGKIKEFEKGVNGFQVAESISNSLLKKAVAMQVNGVQRDLCDSINEDAEIKIITKFLMELSYMYKTLGITISTIVFLFTSFNCMLGDKPAEYMIGRLILSQR